jgi:hypothetical protein
LPASSFPSAGRRPAARRRFVEFSAGGPIFIFHLEVAQWQSRARHNSSLAAGERCQLIRGRQQHGATSLELFKMTTRPMIGDCGRPAERECGMKGPMECATLAPLQPNPEAEKAQSWARAIRQVISAGFGHAPTQ